MPEAPTPSPSPAHGRGVRPARFWGARSTTARSTSPQRCEWRWKLLQLLNPQVRLLVSKREDNVSLLFFQCILQGDQVLLQGVDRGLRAVGQMQLDEDVRYVGAHCRLTDGQLLRNLMIRAPARNQRQHVQFARRQVVQRRLLALAHLMEHTRGYHR